MMRMFALVVAATALGTMAATAQTTVIHRGEGDGGSRTVIKRGGDSDAVVVKRRKVVTTRPACRVKIVRTGNVTKKTRICG